jgi:hypothetical protein
LEHLPTFTFAILFPAKSKLEAWKQGRCTEKASARKEIQSKILPCFRKMRRAHRAPRRALLHRNSPALRVRRVRPPGPRNDAAASWFFRATPLLPGQAMPEIQSILRYSAKSEGGQEIEAQQEWEKAHKKRTLSTAWETTKIMILLERRLMGKRKNPFFWGL